MIHLSSRLAWHDSGWNGRICQHPHLNASCIVTETIRDKRDDDKERQHAGVQLTELDGWLPPCSRDTNVFSPDSYPIIHADPLERSFLRPTVEKIPPYSGLAAPYRWMSEVNFRDICEAEGLSIRGPNQPDKEGGWVYEPDRQLALLNTFWGRLKEHEGNALVFYYVNHGNPVDEEASRMVVGVSRLKKVGPQLYFEGTDPEGQRYPIWTRAVTHDHTQGFRLPYQEYIQAGHDPKTIACYVPKEARLAFSYIGEHVTDRKSVV